MRINTVFSKKVSTGNYENETFTVTVEAESEFNEIDKVADYLFHQAKSAVQRAIEGSATTTTPTTTIPVKTDGKAQDNTGQQTSQETGTAEKKATKTRRRTRKTGENNVGGTGGNSQSNGPLPITDKQKAMIESLAGEVFDTEKEVLDWVNKEFGITDLNKITRKTASRVIEGLLTLKRTAA